MKRLAILCLLAAVLAPVALFAIAGVIEQQYAVEVYILSTLRSAEDREDFRVAVYDAEKDPVPLLYGEFESREAVKVVIFRPEEMKAQGKLIVPAEDPSLRLLYVNRAAYEEPLVARSLYNYAFLAGAGCTGMALLLSVLLFIGAAARRKKTRNG